MNWIVLALVAALATSLTSVFAKVGIKNVPNNLATTYRTGVVIVCCVGMCMITGNFSFLSELTATNWIFLTLSGVATGCSWLCYYRALKLGNINKVAPIDKSSFVLTSLLFLVFFFNDTTRGGNVWVIFALVLSMAFMLSGVVLMLDKKDVADVASHGWLLYAVLSAVFASLVSLFVKIGLGGIPSDLGTLIRTVIVFVFALSITLARGEQKQIDGIDGSGWLFLTLSGVATGVAWLCEYYALNIDGVSPVAVNAIGKLSVLLTMAFSAFVLKERFTKRALFGLLLLTVGIVLTVVFSL